MILDRWGSSTWLFHIRKRNISVADGMSMVRWRIPGYRLGAGKISRSYWDWFYHSRKRNLLVAVYTAMIRWRIPGHRRSTGRISRRYWDWFYHGRKRNILVAVYRSMVRRCIPRHRRCSLDCVSAIKLLILYILRYLKLIGNLRQMYSLMLWWFLGINWWATHPRRIYWGWIWRLIRHWSERLILQLWRNWFFHPNSCHLRLKAALALIPEDWIDLAFLTALASGKKRQTLPTVLQPTNRSMLLRFHHFINYLHFTAYISVRF